MRWRSRPPRRFRTHNVLTVAAFADPGVTMRIEPVFLFDLDGTLIDSVYQHVLA
jgi:hypothetical protein